MKREELKRYQPIFCLVVFAILGLGFYQEHVGRVGPVDEFPFPDASGMDLEELHVPGGTHLVKGRVFDSQGQPAEGVQISLQRARPSLADAEPLHWTLSDAEGRYQLQGLEAVEYEALLYCVGVPLSQSMQSLTPPIVGDHDFILAAPAPPVEAIPEVLRSDLAGKVNLPAGRLLSENPLEGYAVVARPLSHNDEMTGAVTRHGTLDNFGLFTFKDLVLGPYRLELLPPWGAGGSWPVVGSMTWEHSAGATASDVLFPMLAGAVTGVVLDLDSNPIVGAVVLLWAADKRSHVWPLSQTGSDGRVTINDLPAGTYVVRVRAGSASSEVRVEVREGVTSGLTFDALDPASSAAGD